MEQTGSHTIQRVGLSNGRTQIYKKGNRGEKEFCDSFLDVYWVKGVELMPFILVYKGPSIWQSSLVPFLVLPLKKTISGRTIMESWCIRLILGETIVTNGAREYTVIKLS